MGTDAWVLLGITSAETGDGFAGAGLPHAITERIRDVGSSLKPNSVSAKST